MPEYQYKTAVFCTLQFVGFHSWKEADGKNAFLRHIHRHQFHIKATVGVNGLDREIEFISLKEKIQKFVNEKYEGKTFPDSCEQLALDILREFNLDEVTVSEDQENGATVTKIAFGATLADPV